MSGSSEFLQLPTPDWHRLEPLIGRFEAAWSQAGPAQTVDLGSYLPPATDPLRLFVLRELIAVDLEMRWKRGAGVLLDHYVDEFPELGSARSLPALLLVEEYRVRRRYGDRPALDVYRARFPDQFPQLLRRIEEDPELRATATSRGTRGPAPPPAAAPAGEPEVPAVVGEYRMVRRIGAGTFGQVWRAQAPDGTEVAVKIITRPLDERAARRELQVLEHLKSLRHAHLVRTRAFWVLDERLHIVMELAEGSLNDRAARCREQGLTGVPVGELLGYFGEAAEALDYLHARRVHHRDVKPANLLLQGGHVKVADFGLARLMATQASVADATMCGTPAYMAPEVWHGKVSRHSDQWSLAATYAELRLSRRLFPSSNMATLMATILEGKFDPAPLPEAEQQVLRTALALDPHHRHGSCREFVRALEEALRGSRGGARSCEGPAADR